MNKTEKKAELKTLKTALKKRRELCKDCPMNGWGDCGHCAEPGFVLQKAIERFEKELAA
jgi:hypothetical protein